MGVLAGDQLDLKSADGKITVTGVVDEGMSVGDVTVNGKTWAYATDAVELPAGLYEGRGNVKGVVTRIEAGGLVTVRFAKDQSERKLMLEYAPLEKIG